MDKIVIAMHVPTDHVKLRLELHPKFTAMSPKLATPQAALAALSGFADVVSIIFRHVWEWLGSHIVTFLV